MTHSARLSNSFNGEWELYVVIGDTTSQHWPAHDFRRSAPVPTPAERAAALTALGYEVADGAEWEWMELSSDPAEPVELLASADVRPIGGGS